MANIDDEEELQIEIEKDEPEGLEVETAELTKAGAPEKPDKPDTVEKSDKGEPVVGADAAVAELTKQRDALEIRLKTTVKSASQQRADAQRQLAESHLSATANALSATEAEIAELRRTFIEAQQSGDYDKAADVQLQMGEKAADRRDLARNKEQIENYLKNPGPVIPDDPVEAMIATAAQSGQPLSSQAAAWMREHPEVASDDVLLSKVGYLHKAALKDGLKADTEEYYNFINEQMGFGEGAEPAPAKPKSNGHVSAPAQPKRKTVSAPVSRDVATSNGNLSGAAVRLTAREAAAATDGTHTWAYDDPTDKKRFKKGDPIGLQEFARRKKKLAESGAYDATQFNQ